MKWFGIAGAIAACAVWIVNVPLERVARGHNDFLGQYVGARLAGTPGLHELAPNEWEQMRAAGVSMPTEVFMRPDYYAVLLKPLGALPYPAAYAIYTVLNGGALMLAFYLMRSRQNALLLSLCSIPLLVSFMNGQDLPLLLAALMSAVVLDRQGRSFIGGLVLALCSIKPHLFVFLPLALLAGRRLRMFYGAAAGVGGLTLLACAFQGWGWMGCYARLLLQPDMHPMPFPLPNLRGLAEAFAGGSSVVEAIGCVVIVTALGWIAMQAARSDSRASFEHLLAACLVGGLLVSHHLGLHDCALLLAVVTLAIGDSWLYKSAVLVSAPFIYFVLLLPIPLSGLPAFALVGGLLKSTGYLEEKYGGPTFHGEPNQNTEGLTGPA